MKVYVVIEYYLYEGYDKPEFAFDSLEKAEAKRDQMMAEYRDRKIAIHEVEVK